MSKTIPELTQELANLQAEKLTFDGLIAEAAQKQTDLQSALDSEKEKSAQLETEVSAKVAEIATLTESASALTEEISSLKASAKTVTQQASEIAASFGFKAQEKGSTEAEKQSEKKPGEGLSGIAKAIAIHQAEQNKLTQK